MNRRGFLQSLAAGAAVVMLPSLASERVLGTAIPTATALPATTAAGLTTWMRNTFAVTDALPAAFMTIKTHELAGFGVEFKDVPKEKLVHDPVTDEPVAAKFDHFVMAYGVEGDDPVEAERRLVEAAYNELSKIEGGIPLFLRTTPTFSHERMAEYGDTYMTWEEINDRGMPEVLPENVEQDFSTDTLRYVKRRYTLNKLRLRLSLPTLPEEQEEALCITEGTRLKRI
jgi:hypothetical protein